MSDGFDRERAVLNYMTAGVIASYMLSAISAVAGYAFENETLQDLAFGLAVGASATGVVTVMGRSVFFD